MVTGVVLALAASGCWAALDAQRKALATELGPLALVAWMAAGQTAAFGAWWGIAGGALPTSAYWAPGVPVLVANLVASVGFVEATKRAVGLVASVASGRVVFGEPVTVGKLGGIAVMTAGVAAIVLG
jgi:hypothetical protein